MTQRFSQLGCERRRTGVRRAGLTALAVVLTACGGGGGGGGGSTPPPAPPDPPDPPPVTGDDARRAVLADIGDGIILPAVRDFDARAGELEAAAEALALAPADPDARANARAAWDAAMASWQRNEVLQVGPAGRSANPDMVAGGQDFRELIYSWPVTLDVCGLEAAALNGDDVGGTTPIDLAGLGALEHLLFTDAPPASCSAQPNGAARAAHVQKLAARLALVAGSLRNRWEPAGGNFVAQWSTAGTSGSVVYSRPQDALDALSIALFYVEKVTKDRKIAYTTGIGATGLACGNPTSCPEFLESRLSRRSGANLAANVQTFRDVFTGVDGGLGINDLLDGIGRGDLAAQIVAELDAVLARLQSIEVGQGFDAAVEAIANRTDCVNAFSSSIGEPAPCALLGLAKTAMDTFRIEIVAALGLAVPSSAAGDND